MYHHNFNVANAYLCASKNSHLRASTSARRSDTVSANVVGLLLPTEVEPLLLGRIYYDRIDNRDLRS